MSKKLMGQNDSMNSIKNNQIFHGMEIEAYKTKVDEPENIETFIDYQMMNIFKGMK